MLPCALTCYNAVVCISRSSSTVIICAIFRYVPSVCACGSRLSFTYDSSFPLDFCCSLSCSQGGGGGSGNGIEWKNPKVWRDTQQSFETRIARHENEDVVKSSCSPSPTKHRVARSAYLTRSTFFCSTCLLFLWDSTVQWQMNARSAEQLRSVWSQKPTSYDLPLAGWDKDDL